MTSPDYEHNIARLAAAAAKDADGWELWYRDDVRYLLAELAKERTANAEALAELDAAWAALGTSPGASATVAEAIEALVAHWRGVMERLREEQRRDLADVDHFRAMARRHMDERDAAEARGAERERAAIVADLRETAKRLNGEAALEDAADRYDSNAHNNPGAPVADEVPDAG